MQLLLLLCYTNYYYQYSTLTLFKNMHQLLIFSIKNFIINILLLQFPIYTNFTTIML